MHPRPDYPMSERSDWRAHLQGCLSAACILEATARKPGNVHPGAAFADVTFEDFVRSAQVTAPVLADARDQGVGRAIREAVAVTQRAVGRNTNLGIILLLAPLAASSPEVELGAGIDDVLEALTIDDARECFAAIRQAAPGGIGHAEQQDVSASPTVTLREAMALAAERDLIARQYSRGFEDVLQFGVPALLEELKGHDWETATIRLHLRFMVRHPDSHIMRKCGSAVARSAVELAQRVLDADWPVTPTSARSLEELDRWLRADGHRRNPGTSADLVAASLFATLRDRRAPVGVWPE